MAMVLVGRALQKVGAVVLAVVVVVQRCLVVWVITLSRRIGAVVVSFVVVVVGVVEIRVVEFLS